MQHTAVLIALAAASIAGMSLRPLRVPSWIWPMAGAASTIALGYQPVDGALLAIARQWNVLLFILGLMGIAAAAEESGAFTWITDVILERARGSRRRLFVLLFVTGAVLTLLFSNDATAIVLTPIVYQAVVKRDVDAMPFLFACTFVADTASFGLPFSNPANILILPHAKLAPYLLHMGVPQSAAIALNLFAFLFIFRSRLRGRYPYERANAPTARVVRTLVAMGAVGVAYFLAVTFSWPLGVVACGGAVFTLTVALIDPASAARHIGWSTFALLAGLFAIMDAVARAGFVTWALRSLESVAPLGTLATNTVAAFGAAVLSNALNNLPVAVASSYVASHDPAQHLAFPLIVGVDLGPNLTTAGSLATILWVSVLRKRGVRVNPLEYVRLGLVVVPLTLAVTVVWFWIVR